MHEGASDPSPPAPSSRVAVVAAAIRSGGRCLLGRRPPESRHGGLWEFPGGKVDAGESHAEALARELREELGVDVEVGERLAEVDHDYPHIRLTLTLYACRLIRGEPRPRYHREVGWFLPREIDPSSLAAADRELLARMG